MTYRIGQLAKACNVNKETIRFYERKLLLPKPLRNESGYRIYSLDTVKRVKFIKRLQALNFQLSEIHRLLGVFDKDVKRCEDMYEFVSEKEHEIEKQIENLRNVSQMLQTLKACCPVDKDMHACPIIEQLIDGKNNENREV